MSTEKFILAQSDHIYADKVVETTFQFRQIWSVYVFFQYNNSVMVARFKMKFK